MKKIDFVNGTTIDGAKTFNDMQSNVEEVFNGDTPMGSIVVENIKSINMFDGNIETGGYTATGDKDTNTTNIRNVSPIEVQPNEEYIFSNDGTGITINVYEYDSNYTFIKTSTISANNSFTTTSTTNYVNWWRASSNTNKVKLEKGSTITPYTPFKKFGYGIVDSGSNANGSYIKYADGNMICRGSFTATISTSAWGSLHAFDKTNCHTFPVPFVEQPTLQVSVNDLNWAAAITRAVASTTQIVSISGIRGTTVSNQAYNFSYIAIGKWKTDTSTASEVSTTSLENEES